jgi:hypothetical protein
VPPPGAAEFPEHLIVADLIGVRAKLGRAAEHSGAFDAVFNTWVNSHPYGFTYKLDPDSGWWHFRWHALQPPPMALGLIFADMLTNLRGTLDYLAWQLVLSGGNTPTKRTAFPVVRQAQNWPSAAGDQLRGVHPRWISAVERLQPYHRRQTPELHPLAVLDHLNNVHKHRALPPVVSHQLQWNPGLHGDLTGRKLDMVSPTESVVEDQAIFFSVRFTPTLNELDVDMEVPSTVAIQFDDGGGPYGTTLRSDLLDWVTRSVAIFEPAF